MPFCHACGQKYTEGARFCEHCGKAVPATVAPRFHWSYGASLVVIVAVIGLLILFAKIGKRQEAKMPAATSAESEAQQEAIRRNEASDCLANLKNLSLAAQMFLADHGDRFPRCETWVGELKPYVRSDDVFRCPGDDVVGMGCSYAMNVELSRKHISEVDDPTDTVVFFETKTPGLNPVGGPGDVVSPLRHPDGTNYAFADGSARSVEQVPNFVPRHTVRPASQGTSESGRHVRSGFVPGVGTVDPETGEPIGSAR